MSLTALPPELIELIIFHDTLSYSDVVNIQYCCKSLYDVVHNNDQLWRTRFLQRWPKCLLSKQHKTVRSWRALYMLRESWDAKTSQAILRATEILLHKEEAPKCILPAVFGELSHYGEDFMSDCIVDELFHLCSTPQKPPLSEQYYGRQLLQRLHSEQLKKRWEKLISDSGGIVNVCLEDGIRFVGQHALPDVDYRSNDVEEFFSQYVEETIIKVRADDSSLADRLASIINSGSKVEMGSWTAMENSVIMTGVLSKVQDGSSSQIWSSVGTLEQRILSPGKSLPRLLAIVTAVCVGQRLGVRCEILLIKPPDIGFAFRFPGYDMSGERESWAYVRSSMKPECGELSHSLMPPNNILEVLSQYAELTLPSDPDALYFVETKAYLNPNNMNHARAMLMTYLRYLINIDEARALMERIRQEGGRNFMALLDRYEHYVNYDELKIPHVTVKRRSDPHYSDVKFSVGMIMSHVRFGYDCVITGWTPICEADDGWIRQMRVDRLPLGPNQPFYNVLVPDGSSRYAAQENLLNHPHPVAITHQAVGKYMKTFRQTHYIMNHAVAIEYPDDTAFTINTAKQRYPNVNS